MNIAGLHHDETREHQLQRKIEAQINGILDWHDREEARKQENERQRFANIDDLLDWEDQFEELENGGRRHEKLEKRRVGRVKAWTEEKAMTERRATEMYPTESI